jgi:choline-sulfatase
MADQLAAPALPIYGHKVVKAPHLEALARTAAVFDNAYCNFPICAPSRASLLTGRLPTSFELFDNGSEFPASLPTLPHYLKLLGYSTSLVGKMHFVGPDQLHGFEDRPVTEIYPADFNWTPDWTEGPTNRPSGVSLRGVTESGPCRRSLQIDYDEETESHAHQKLWDLARAPERQPFFLTVSFSHPHSPFTAPQEHWDRYSHDDIDMPLVPTIPLEQLDEASRWIYYHHARDQHTITDEHVRNARHAYYAMISYIDDKVGRIMHTLKEAGLDDDTVVIFTSDHGEMMGERGMWYKQTFFEWSARVPLIVRIPNKASTTVSRVVSLVDLFPTVLELAANGCSPEVEVVDPLDGHSLTPLIDGKDEKWADTAICEYTDMGVIMPCRMLRHGRYKYIYTHRYPAQLYDLQIDPNELIDLSGQEGYREIERELQSRVLCNWDPEDVLARVLQSQKRRNVIKDMMQQSDRYPNWSHLARPEDAKRYVRGSVKAGGSMGTKARARFPQFAPKN